METKLTYDFSTTYKTIYNIIIRTPHGSIIYNNIPMGNETYLSSTLRESALSNIQNIQQDIFNVINNEIKDNSKYRLYFNQYELKLCLQWIKDQLTIDILTKFITDDNYVHLNEFKYNHIEDIIKVPLVHVKDFFIEKTTWKYNCPDCNTIGEITVDKNDMISREVKCHECGLNFSINIV